MNARAMGSFGTRVPAQHGAIVEDRPIDLVHLSRQTLGDRNLEIELLGLFERQAGMILRQLTQVTNPGDRRLRHDLAHTLKGSARAVGAGAVAAAAQTLEERLYGGAGEVELQQVMATLGAAVTDAQAAATALLGDK